jgi:hypothetical protein
MRGDIECIKPCEIISNWHTTWILGNGSSNNLQNVVYSHSSLTQLHSVRHQKGELPSCSPPQNKNWKQRQEEVNGSVRFTLQPKSANKIGWWLVKKMFNHLPNYIKSLQRFLYSNSFYAIEEYLNYNKQLNSIYCFYVYHYITFFSGSFIISYFKIKC